MVGRNGLIELENTLGTPYAGATDVSADGTVVVGTVSDPHQDYGRAFRWTWETGMEDIGTLNIVNGGVLGGGDGSIGVLDTGIGEGAVLDLGWVDSQFVRIGGKKSGEGKVTIASRSAWANESLFIIGDEGYGSLTIRAGGVMLTDHVSIGHVPDARGVLSVTDPGSESVTVWRLRPDSTCCSPRRCRSDSHTTGGSVRHGINGFRSGFKYVFDTGDSVQTATSADMNATIWGRRLPSRRYRMATAWSIRLIVQGGFHRATLA